MAWFSFSNCVVVLAKNTLKAVFFVLLEDYCNNHDICAHYFHVGWLDGS